MRSCAKLLAGPGRPATISPRQFGVYEHMDMHGAAYDAAARAVARQPRNVDNRVALAQRAWNQGRKVEARDHVRAAVDLLTSSNRFDRVIAIGDEWLARDPDCGDLLCTVAAAAIAMGQPHRAVNRLLDYLRGNPRDGQAQGLMVKAEAALADCHGRALAAGSARHGKVDVSRSPVGDGRFRRANAKGGA